jgi:hypothetical protein
MGPVTSAESSLPPRERRSCLPAVALSFFGSQRATLSDGARVKTRLVRRDFTHRFFIPRSKSVPIFTVRPSPCRRDGAEL